MRGNSQWPARRLRLTAGARARHRKMPAGRRRFHALLHFHERAPVEIQGPHDPLERGARQTTLRGGLHHVALRPPQRVLDVAPLESPDRPLLALLVRERPVPLSRSAIALDSEVTGVNRVFLREDQGPLVQFSSSRTLPGHLYCCSASIASSGVVTITIYSTW